MKPRTIAILTGAGVALLFLLLSYLVLLEKPRHYSAHFKVQVNPRPGSQKEGAELMNFAENIIRERVAASGYDLDVDKGPGNMMELVFSDVDDTTMINHLLLTEGVSLGFREIQPFMDMVPVLKKLAGYPTTPQEETLTENGLQVEDAGEEAPGLKRFKTKEKVIEKKSINGQEVPEFEPPQLFDSPHGEVRYPSHIGMINVNDTAAFSKILRDSSIINASPPHTKFCYGMPERNGVLSIYAINTKGREIAILGNDDIKTASPSYSQTGNAIINFEFNQAGTLKWKTMTTENVNKPIAMVIDNMVVSAPFVTAPIGNGKCELQGGFSSKDAITLASQLDAGNFPVHLDILEQKIVKETVMFPPRVLLFALLAGLLTGFLTWLIPKSLKTK